jgi:hypothetical protein
MRIERNKIKPLNPKLKGKEGSQDSNSEEFEMIAKLKIQV